MRLWPSLTIKPASSWRELGKSRTPSVRTDGLRIRDLKLGFFNVREERGMPAVYLRLSMQEATASFCIVSRSWFCINFTPHAMQYAQMKFMLPSCLFKTSSTLSFHLHLRALDRNHSMFSRSKPVY